jgi:hypothetical protein
MSKKPHFDDRGRFGLFSGYLECVARLALRQGHIEPYVGRVLREERASFPVKPTDEGNYDAFRIVTGSLANARPSTNSPFNAEGSSMVVEHPGFCQAIARPLHPSIDPTFLVE